MQRMSHLTIISLIIWIPGITLAAQSPSILESKVERHQGPPLWISAKTVASGDKIIDLDLVNSDTLRRRVERQRLTLGSIAEKSVPGEKPEIVRIPASECRSESFQEDVRAGDGPSSSLQDLLIHAKSIVHGTVSTVELGFSFGSPSSLLGINALETLKGHTPESSFYLDYPVARFKIGPFSFCNATKGFEPRPGDEVLFFDFAGPVDRSGTLYVPRVDQIFFQKNGGGLFMANGLKNTGDLRGLTNIKEIINLLRSEKMRATGGAR